jgi:adenosine deaminase
MSAIRIAGSIAITGIVGTICYYCTKFSRRRDSGDVTRSLLVEEVSEHNESLDPSQLEAFMQQIPKIELHCHLNGAVRPSTLEELDPEQASTTTVQTIEDAFKVFKRVYSVVNSEVTLRRIVSELVEDMVTDNVRYLELRTTPRKLSDVPSLRRYVEVIIDELRINSLVVTSPEFAGVGKIFIRLLLTVNRSDSVQSAEKVVDLALRFSNWVVGIDFAGNPSVGHFRDFRGVFERARGHGLFTTVHCSEIPGVEDETDEILNFRPNRIGHFLFPTPQQTSQVLQDKIFIESCPTSNMIALSGRSGADLTTHSTLNGFARSGLVSVNTDDPGVFRVTLSHEWCKVVESQKLKTFEIAKIIENSIENSFLNQNDKILLKSKFTFNSSNS